MLAFGAFDMHSILSTSVVVIAAAVAVGAQKFKDYDLPTFVSSTSDACLEAVNTVINCPVFLEACGASVNVHERDGWIFPGTALT
jgi:hypothetical protein